MGAPNLTDNIWLYGGTEADIIAMVTNGEGASSASGGTSAMPAHKDSSTKRRSICWRHTCYSLSHPATR